MKLSLIKLKTKRNFNCGTAKYFVDYFVPPKMSGSTVLVNNRTINIIVGGTGIVWENPRVRGGAFNFS